MVPGFTMCRPATDPFPRKLDVRVIGATNRNLEQKVIEDSFREDLYYRLQVIRIEVPPLRERREDILPLVNNFVKKCSSKLELPNLRLDATCMDYLINYLWPGNIRELENAIEHAAVFCKESGIIPENLPSQITRKSRSLKETDVADLSRRNGVRSYSADPGTDQWA